MPGGYQVALGIRLAHVIERAEALFTEHELPAREEFVAELTLWRCHTADGIAFMRRCDDILSAVLRGVPR